MVQAKMSSDADGKSLFVKADGVLGTPPRGSVDTRLETTLSLLDARIVFSAEARHELARTAGVSSPVIEVRQDDEEDQADHTSADDLLGSDFASTHHLGAPRRQLTLGPCDWRRFARGAAGFD